MVKRMEFLMAWSKVDEKGHKMVYKMVSNLVERSVVWKVAT